MNFFLTANGLFHSLKIFFLNHNFKVFSLSLFRQVFKSNFLSFELICQSFPISSPDLETTFIASSVYSSVRWRSNITYILFFPSCCLESFKLIQIAYLTKLHWTVSACTYKVFISAFPTCNSQVMGLKFLNWGRNWKFRFEVYFSK